MLKENNNYKVTKKTKIQKKYKKKKRRTSQKGNCQDRTKKNLGSVFRDTQSVSI